MGSSRRREKVPSPHGMPPPRVEVTEAPTVSTPSFASGIGTSPAATVEGGEWPGLDLALALVGNCSVIKRGVLENAMNPVVQIEVELQGIEARLVEERLRLAHGWHRLETAVKLGHW